MKLLSVALAFILACSIIAGADEVLEDFSAARPGEPPPGWELRGTNGYASDLTTVADAEGERAAALDYDFTAANRSGWLSRGARKTAIMGTWLRIPRGHWVLEIELTGDGSGHGLVVSIGETGEWFNFDLGRIDFTDRRTLRLDLATGARDWAGPESNGWIEPPLWLASVNLEQTPGAPETGRLVVHGIHASDQPPSGLSALCARWALPEGGVFFEGVEDAALRLGLQNIAREDVVAEATWTLSRDGERERQVTQGLAVAAQGEVELKLPMADLPVGFYDADVELAAGETTRTLRTSLAMVPEPGEGTERFGAGLVALPRETEETVAVLAEGMRRLGARWTVAEVDFRAFDGATIEPSASQQREVLATLRAHGIDAFASFAAVPHELGIDAEDLSARYQGALRRAADCFGLQTTRWALALPRYQPDAKGLPAPTALTAFAGLLAEARAALPECEIAARLTAAELMQWQAEGVAWPEGVGLIVEDSRADILQRRIPTIGVDGEIAVALRTSALELPDATQARRHAEGLAWALATMAHKLPEARLMVPLRTYSKPGGLLTSDGAVAPVGLAFAVCAYALGSAEPERDFRADDVRGWLFRRGDERIAFAWPTRRGQEATLAISATGPLRHFGMAGEYDQVPAGATEVTLRPGANVLVGEFGL